MLTVSGAELALKPITAGARGLERWTKCSCSIAMFAVAG